MRIVVFLASLFFMLHGSIINSFAGTTAKNNKTTPVYQASQVQICKVKSYQTQLNQVLFYRTQFSQVQFNQAADRNLAYHYNRCELLTPIVNSSQASIQKTTAPEENKIYICEAVDEEDDDQSSRKHQPISDFFSGLDHQYRITVSDSGYNAIPSFDYQAAPRYIFQRTLRI